MYFNTYDPAERVGGFLRLGNRANEGYAEMTTCIYLPDGRIGFTYARPEISDNDAFDAGGMRFEVITPFEALKTRTPGRSASSTSRCRWRTRARRSPRTPGSSARSCSTTAAPLDVRRRAGERRRHSAHRGPLRRVRPRSLRAAHRRARLIRVGDEEWAVDGYGLRDHSWGPRFWQAPWWYRWLTINFGEDAGFVVSIVTSRDGTQRVGGMALENGEYHHLDRASIETQWTGEDLYHQEMRVTAASGDREYEITGSVLNLIPLRNRRTTPEGESLVTRISEGMSSGTGTAVPGTASPSTSTRSWTASPSEPTSDRPSIDPATCPGRSTDSWHNVEAGCATAPAP